MSHASQPGTVPSFAAREFALPERLDAPCTYADWYAASRQLAAINRWTAAHAPVQSLVSQVLLARGNGYRPLHVVDVGCGLGDGLRALLRWSERRSVTLKLTGVDQNPYAARAARDEDRRLRVSGTAIRWVTADLFDWQPETPPDVVVCSLLPHHLPDAGIVRLLRWMHAHARWAWLVSDLRRSQRAHDVFAAAARTLRLHPFLQHDGPVSFRRALSEAEWHAALAQAELSELATLQCRRWSKLTVQCKDTRARLAI